MKRKTKVLIADYNVHTVTQLEKLIRSDDTLTCAGKAYDGRQTLSMIKECRPDIVLLDLIMPYIDGLDIMHMVRTDPELTSPPAFIIISAIGKESIIEDAFMEGARHYIMKPYDPANVLNRIHQVAEMRHAVMPVPFQITSANKSRLISKGLVPVFDLEQTVADMLVEAGVPPHIRGYQYLKDAIMVASENQSVMNSVTKILYPTVAKMNCTTPARVERCIRNAIELTWTRGSSPLLEKLFSYTINSQKGKPTNGEFVALMSDQIRIRKKNAQKHDRK